MAKVTAKPTESETHCVSSNKTVSFSTPEISKPISKPVGVKREAPVIVRVSELREEEEEDDSESEEDDEEDDDEEDEEEPPKPIVAPKPRSNNAGILRNAMSINLARTAVDTTRVTKNKPSNSDVVQNPNSSVKPTNRSADDLRSSLDLYQV